MTYRIVLEKDGQTYYASPEWIETQLKLNDLRNRVHTLEKPLRQQTIIDLLRSENQPRMSNWLARRLKGTFDYFEFFELVRDGKVEKFKKGNVTLYKVKGGG